MEGGDGVVPRLDPASCRILGCLVEKERATPQNYPLTLNALRLACNQSTNRDPVVDYDDRVLDDRLTWLREHHLIRIVYSPSNRAAKYRHVLDEVLRADDAELAVLCVLLLRGAQTAGEIKGRTERLHPFADLGAVAETLDRLIAREPALVARLERQPGQKDARYVHLLDGRAGEVDAPAASPVTSEPPSAPTEPAPSAYAVADAAVPEPAAPADPGLADRVAELEAEVARLRADLDALLAELS